MDDQGKNNQPGTTFFIGLLLGIFLGALLVLFLSNDKEGNFEKRLKNFSAVLLNKISLLLKGDKEDPSDQIKALEANPVPKTENPSKSKRFFKKNGKILKV